MIDISLTKALQEICRRQIRFVLVGGAAAMLDGAPIHTYDIDVVYDRESHNIERILDFLGEADAVFNIQRHRKLRPNKSHLEGRGPLNLETRYGRIDFLALIGKGLDYESLVAQSRPIAVSEDCVIQVLKLETIIALKEEVGGPKDLAVLPTLRAALREKEKRDGN